MRPSNEFLRSPVAGQPGGMEVWAGGRRKIGHVGTDAVATAASLRYAPA